MIVVVNGGYRTGSTLAWNIARLLMESYAGIPEERCYLSDHPRNVEEDLDLRGDRVIKTHVWTPLLGRHYPHLRLIHTVRNPFDVAASLLRHGRTWAEILSELQFQSLQRVVHTRYDFQRIHAPLLVDYDYFYGLSPNALPDYIDRHLGLKTPRHVIEEIGEKTRLDRHQDIQEDIPEGAQDDRTLLQHQHIGPHQGKPGEGRKELQPWQIDSIRVSLDVLGLKRAETPDP